MTLHQLKGQGTLPITVVVEIKDIPLHTASCVIIQEKTLRWKVNGIFVELEPEYSDHR
jgi:hypothetical protein